MCIYNSSLHSCITVQLYIPYQEHTSLSGSTGGVVVFCYLNSVDEIDWVEEPHSQGSLLQHIIEIDM